MTTSSRGFVRALFVTTAVWFFSPTAALATLGDMNCNGDLTVDDIGPFVLALVDPVAYEQSWTCIENADMNGDLSYDGLDIQPFVVALLTPPQTGACCFTNGSCTVDTEAACTGSGGAYEGDGTDCDPNPCPQPQGACCVPDGSCSITTEAACSGLYQGDGTTCSPNPCEPYCPEATIVIEIYTDDYASETTWTLSLQGGGVIASGGSDYSDFTLYTHEICVTYAGCHDFTIFDSYGDGICCDYGNGYYNIYYEGGLVASGGGFDSQETVSDIGGCIFVGACCFADGSCTGDIEESACDTAGGTYQGDGIACSPNPCPQPGACCLPDGTCSQALESECDGVWQGAGVDCSPDPCTLLGACCMLDGSCDYVLQGDCTGNWQGAGTMCEPNLCPQPPSGACCMPDGSCASAMTEANCLAVSGTYQGDDVACASVSCPQPATPTKAQLAGNSLAGYPYFEYVKAFNVDAEVKVAIDPTRYPGVIGRTCDLFIVNAKNETQWMADSSLVDARGVSQPVTFSGGTIQANTFSVIAAYELSADAGLGLGVGYDVVLDFDRDGYLTNGDYIDGLEDEAGLYLVHDTTQPGPLAVTEITYSGGSWLGQDTYYPTNISSMGQLPLIVISHGNGHNYTWYDHIGYHMASYGYVVMSHENNTGPGIETASTTTLTNTDYIIGNQGSIQGGVLNGHIDSSRITWIGHSRGAEGIARAYDRIYDGYTPSYFTIDDIVLLSSMLPVDFLKTSQSNPHDANYHLWTASGDNDVNGSASCDLCQTYHLHERATKYRMSTTVQGTGHGDFHDASGSVFTGPCHIEPKSVVHDIMNGLFLPLIKHYVEGNIPATDFFWRQYEHFHPIGVDTSNTCIVVSNEYRNGADTGNFFIDDYESQTATGTSSSGGSVTYTVQNLTEGRLDDNNSSFSWTTSDPFNGATQDSSEGSDNGRGVVFDWNGSNRYYEWEVIASQQDLSDDLYLSFRGAQGTQHPYTLAESGDLTFSVTLRDGSGTSSSINVGVYGGGFEQPYDRSGGWHNEMEVIKIRLTDFLHNGSGLDLTDVAAIRLDCGPSWGSNEGRIVIDEMMITNDVPPPPAGS